jgi:glycosyltransferase involved in cell wall biosynthesis
MLASTPPGIARRSGYTRVAGHVPGAELIETARRGDRSFFEKGIRRILQRGAVTSWYQYSSARLEWRAWQRLRQGFRGVVHVLWADSDLGYADLLAKRRGAMVCGTFHGCAEDLPSVIRRPERLRGLDAIIVVSTTQIDYFRSQGVPDEKIVFVPHGIDTAYFTPADGVAERPVLKALSVGSYRRNFDLLRAVCEALQDDSRFEFEIISSPRNRALFEGLRNVRFRSGLSDEELVDAYRTASCLLMTVQASTANNAVLEALACGVPVVTERVGGISEYVDSSCALETEPRNAEELVQALKLLAEQPDLQRRMAAAARRRALSFSWDAVGRLTADVYESLKAVPAYRPN